PARGVYCRTIPAGMWRRHAQPPAESGLLLDVPEESAVSDVVVGSLAPDFTLTAASGDSFTLSQQRGRPVVLYFYPQDDTEGCTVENLEFTRLLPEFSAHGAVVAGISPDSVADHCRFRGKYELGTLLRAGPHPLAIHADRPS